MPGSIEDSLSRFTPSLGDLDRDALLFAAGRASARPDRKWPTLAALLALSQTLTLALCVSGTPTPPRPEPVAPPVFTAPIESPPTIPLIFRDWRSALEETPYSAPVIDDLIPDEPPLHVSTMRDEFPTK